MCSVTLYYIPSYKYSVLESALYNSLHRLGWSIFTGWFVLACVTSESGPIKSFLSSRALVPLSRLTYCAYLTNGFIELYLAASIRTPKYMSVINLVITWNISAKNPDLCNLLPFPMPSWARRCHMYAWRSWQRLYFALCSNHRSMASKKCFYGEIRHQGKVAVSLTNSMLTVGVLALQTPAHQKRQPESFLSIFEN